MTADLVRASEHNSSDAGFKSEREKGRLQARDSREKGTCTESESGKAEAMLRGLSAGSKRRELETAQQEKLLSDAAVIVLRNQVSAAGRRGFRS